MKGFRPRKLQVARCGVPGQIELDVGVEALLQTRCCVVAIGMKQ